MVKLGTICYLDNGKQLLLLHRNKKENDVHAGKWVSVGGKFEAGESPEECAKREILEETGLIAHSLELRGMITFPEFTPEDDWYTYVFIVKDFSGELIECDEGTLEWVDYEEVLSKPTWEGDYIYLEWLLTNQPFFSAKFSYDRQGHLKEHDVIFYERSVH